MGVAVKAPGMKLIPGNTREWDRFFRDLLEINVAESEVDDKAVTLSKITDITADRILGRITTPGTAQELTAAQVVALVQAVAWVFADTVKFDGNVGFYGTTPVAQPAHITDAETAHDVNAVFSDTEVEAALDALGAKINAVILALETLGLKANA